MAVLSAADREAIAVEFGVALSAAHEAVGAIAKADLRAAANALDDFLSTNAAAINSAIPQPARGVLTTAQKARLLQIVITHRYISGA